MKTELTNDLIDRMHASIDMLESGRPMPQGAILMREAIRALAGLTFELDRTRRMLDARNAEIVRAAQPQTEQPGRWCGSCQQHVTRCAGDAQGCPLSFPPGSKR